MCPNRWKKLEISKVELSLGSSKVLLKFSVYGFEITSGTLQKSLSVYHSVEELMASDEGRRRIFWSDNFEIRVIRSFINWNLEESAMQLCYEWIAPTDDVVIHRIPCMRFRELQKSIGETGKEIVSLFD